MSQLSPDGLVVDGAAAGATSTRRTALIGVAWVATLLLSNLPLIVARELLGRDIPWGAIHIVLHLPGMWAEGLPWLPVVIQLTALSLVITWLFIHSGHNVLLVALFHAAQSAFGFVNEGISPLHLTWLMAAVWAFAGLLALVDLVTMGRGLEIGELEIG